MGRVRRVGAPDHAGGRSRPGWLRSWAYLPGYRATFLPVSNACQRTITAARMVTSSRSFNGCPTTPCRSAPNVGAVRNARSRAAPASSSRATVSTSPRIAPTTIRKRHLSTLARPNRPVALRRVVPPVDRTPARRRAPRRNPPPQNPPRRALRRRDLPPRPVDRAPIRPPDPPRPRRAPRTALQGLRPRVAAAIRVPPR